MAIEESLSDQDLEFRFLAGSVGLALTATVGERWNRGFERLRDGGDLARWLVEAEVLANPPEVAADELLAARKLREAIYRAAKARGRDERLPARAVSVINAHAKLAPLAPQLRAGRLTWVSEEPVRAALSLVARDAIELLAGPLAGRIRECASPECALLFVDASRPGRRRWCSSETCGSRARSAAYRTRRAAPLR